MKTKASNVQTGDKPNGQGVSPDRRRGTNVPVPCSARSDASRRTTGDAEASRASLRIIAYFKNKMQVCTVKQIITSDRPNIKLLVFLGKHYRHTSAGTIQFKSETLVDLIEQKSLVCKS